MALDPGRRIGAYEIVGPLGSGGMGEVYRARDMRLGRLVAIKLVSGSVGADPSAHERLEREARLTSSLNHPNIVTVYDVGEVDGQPYIVMEFVSGETLHARMASRPLTDKDVASIAAQVAEGLAAAHTAGVVHRDLKPRNVMLTEDGRAKILDFGLGKVTPPAARSEDPTVEVRDLTDSQAVVGTAGYMAPEQVTNGRIDNRTDQFAFGAIVYEMLTGERAFKRDSPVQTMAAVVEDEPTPLLELNPTAPYELVAVVQRCLEKDPARRYASTLDLARDLENARAGFTPSPWPTPRPQRGVGSRPRPLRLRRVAVPLGLLGAVLAAVWVWGPWKASLPAAEARALLDQWHVVSNVERAVERLSAAVERGSTDPLLHAFLAEAYVRQYETQPERQKDDALIDRARVEIASALTYADIAPAHVVQAMIDNLQRRHTAALEAADRALAVNNRSSEAYRERGRAYLSLGEFDASVADLIRATSLHPDDWTAHHYLGVAYSRQTRPEDAVREFRRALETAPTFPTAASNLGGVLVGLGRTDEALDVLRTSAERCRCATAFSNLGTVYNGLGRDDEALEAYEQAVLMTDARSGHWRNLAAAAHWVPGLEARSTEAYERAVTLGEQELLFDNTNGLLLAGLADAYAVLGRHEQARSTLAALEALEPTDKEVLYTIASVYEQLGDRGPALEWLRRAFAAGKPRGDAERSPWLRDLVKDPRYVNRNN